jgi:hypothetical protein
MEGTGERDHRVMTVVSRVLLEPASERQASLRAACENDPSFTRRSWQPCS